MKKGMFLEIPPVSKREQILTAIWQRSMAHVNSDQFTGFMLRASTRTVRIPPTRPSDPESVRHENCIELKTDFSAASSYAEEYKNTFPKKKADRLLELIISADNFFNSAREFGLGALQYCEEIYGQLRKEFGIKNTDEHPDTNYEEYAHYDLLSVFVVERQLGITKDGFRPMDGPDVNGERYVGLYLHGNERLLYGSPAAVETRRAFIDRLILDTKWAEQMAPHLAELKRRAVELNWQFSVEINRVKEAAEKAERESQGSDTKVDRFLKRIKNNTIMAAIIVLGIGSMAVIGFATSVATVLAWFH